MAKLIISYGDHKGRVRARTTVEYDEISPDQFMTFYSRTGPINHNKNNFQQADPCRTGRNRRAY